MSLLILSYLQKHHKIKTPPIKDIADKVLSKARELESAVAESEASVAAILSAMDEKEAGLKREIASAKRDIEVICKKVEAAAKEVAMLRRLTDDKENRRPTF